MEKNDIDDLLFSDEEIEDLNLDLDLVKKNIPNYTTEKLCEMIVCDRYFGFNEVITVMCMEELAARRQNGDQFAFETYIDQAYNQLPQLNFDIPDIRKVLQQAVGNRKLTIK